MLAMQTYIACSQVKARMVDQLRWMMRHGGSTLPQRLQSLGEVVKFIRPYYTHPMQIRTWSPLAGTSPHPSFATPDDLLEHRTGCHVLVR